MTDVRGMRKMVAILCFVTAVTLAWEPVSAGTDRFAGQWTGTYAGDDSGAVTVTLAVDGEGRHTGSISAIRDQGGSYDIPFKSVAFEADRMTATYDWPEGGEVTLEATFSEDQLSGTWSFTNSAGTNAGGTWKASRKTTEQ